MWKACPEMTEEEPGDILKHTGVVSFTYVDVVTPNAFSALLLDREREREREMRRFRTSEGPVTFSQSRRTFC